MIQPILPLFLVGVLGTSYSIVGLIEGSSDATTSVVKVISGWYSDRLSKRKAFVVAGYLPTAVESKSALSLYQNSIGEPGLSQLVVYDEDCSCF